MASTWLVSTKAALISTAVLSMAVILNLTVPVTVDFLTFNLPPIWSFMASCLRPPYLYLLINCIIISIVASSKLQSARSDGGEVDSAVDHRQVPVKVEEEDLRLNPAVENVYGCEFAASNPAVFGFVDGVVEDKVSETVAEERDDGGGGSELLWSQAKSNPIDCSPVSAEKPLVSARFGHRKAVKAVKASPEGKALGVSKPKRQETLEATWRTITEGRPMPLTRHLKKSDTWETRGRHHTVSSEDPASPPPAHVMKKSETFNDGAGAVNKSPLSSPAPTSGGKMRREPSLSQDELNRRVEAFIKKFNEEMRLQRMESLNQYTQMVNSGSR